MPKIYNQETGKKISQELRVKQFEIPQEASEKIVLNYQVNDPLFYASSRPLIRNATLTNAIIATIHTCSTTRTTFMQGAAIAASIGATHAGETVAVVATPAGDSQSRIVVQLEFQTTVALQNQVQQISFPYPIRLEKGSTVQLIADDATDIEANGELYGFEMEDIVERA